MITISRDTKFVHLAWQRDEKELTGVKYKMGSDVKGDLGRLFGVYDPESGLTLRGTFLIDPKGKIVASEVLFYNIGRNMDELMRRFKANLHVAKKANEACPSKWKDEGDKTLVNPGAKMVGKVHEALKATPSTP